MEQEPEQERIYYLYLTVLGASQVVLVVKNPPANAGDKRFGFDPWLRRFPGGGHSNSLQYSCLENPMDREVWWATVHGVAKSRTRLSDLTHSLRRHIISISHVRLKSS